MLIIENFLCWVESLFYVPACTIVLRNPEPRFPVLGLDRASRVLWHSAPH
jgi:hypothetical protein